MRTLVRVVARTLLLTVAVAGCAAYTAQPAPTARQQCEQTGGIWRAASDSCQREAGGGGGY